MPKKWLGSYLVVLNQQLFDFFRNGKGELISDRELIFQAHSHMYWIEQVFPVNLGMPLHNKVKITFALGKQFYLRSSSQNFQMQAFINYNFLCTRFRAHKITHVKVQTCTSLISTRCSCRNCTKLVLKPLAAKNSLSISVLCIAPFL